MTAAEEQGVIGNRFVLEQVLSQRPHAVVYQARHIALGGLFALKLVRQAGTGLHRARLQAQFRHPNLVAVSDILEHQGNPVMVMEFIDGPTLEDWMGGQPLALEDMLLLMSSILSALAAAHSVGICHGNIDATHVLLARGGDQFIPRLISFSSPDRHDVRDDIHDAGRLIYLMLTGTPWTPGAPLPEGLPSNIDIALNSSLQTDATRRPPDCVRFALLLFARDPALMEAFTHASRPPTSQHLRSTAPLSARWPAMLATALGSALLTLILLQWVAPLLQTQPTSDPALITGTSPRSPDAPPDAPPLLTRHGLTDHWSGVMTQGTAQHAMELELIQTGQQLTGTLLLQFTVAARTIQLSGSLDAEGVMELRDAERSTVLIATVGAQGDLYGELQLDGLPGVPWSAHR